MTTTFVTARERLALVRPAASADVVALSLVAALAVGFAALTWGTWGALDNDTGHDFVAGAHVAAGGLPYVDFEYWYGPLAPALLGLVAWLGGGGVAPFVALGLIVAGAVVGAGYALTRLVAGPVAAGLAAALTVPVAFAPHQFSYVLPHTSAATLGLLGVLGVLLALGWSSRRPDRIGRLVAAGAAAGLTGLTKPEFELAVIAAAAAWFALARRGGTGGWRPVALFAAPAVAIPAAVYGAFLAAVSPRELVLENLYPSDFLSAAGNELLTARAPLSASSLAEVAGRLALYAAGAAALVLLARGLAREGRRRQAAIAGAAGCGVLAVTASVANPEALRHAMQFAWGWVPAGALAAAIVVVLRARRRGVEGPDAIAFAGLAALAAFAATTYAGFFPYATHAQTAVYAMPLAAAFVARLHLVDLARTRQAYVAGAAWLAFLALAGAGLTLKDARAESAVVRGPGGALHESPGDATAYRAALGWIEARTAPGDAILVGPQLTWLYTLSERENPLRDISLLPGAVGGAAAQRAAAAQLDRASVALAVIDRRSYPMFGHSSFGGSFNVELDAWLRRSLAHAATLRGEEVSLEVWVRRTP